MTAPDGPVTPRPVLAGHGHLTLSQAIAAVQQHHPHWHVWRTDTLVWATRCQSADGGSGCTLDAPTPERLDQVLAAWEHKFGWPA